MEYSELPTLRFVYLEDSFVLDILETPDRLQFRLEAVLTPGHPNYHEPRPGEQYCYVDGWLIFRSLTTVEWLRRTPVVSVDASGQSDLGNIDYFRFSGEGWELGGDWGDVKLCAEAAPALEFP